MRLIAHAPPRGYFCGVFPAPIDTPTTLAGDRGERAYRIQELGEHNALYQLQAHGEHLEAIAELNDGTQFAAVELKPLADTEVGAQIVIHPAVGDDPTELVPKVRLDGDAAGVAVHMHNASARHQTWIVTARTDKRLATFALTIRDGSSIVDGEFSVETLDGWGGLVDVEVEFGEPVLLHGVRYDGEARFDVRCNEAGFSGPIPFRIACRSWFDADDDADDPEPLRDLTADEHDFAHLGPWHALPDTWDGNWFGAPIATLRHQLSVLVEEGVAALRNNQLPPWTPRLNPNAGGTDPAFGSSFALLWQRGAGGDVDPRMVRAMAGAAVVWGQHPVHYMQPKSTRPLDYPPRDGRFRTHKLQPVAPVKGEIDGVRVPIGKASDGRHPWDPQHRAFALVDATFACTGSPILERMRELELAAELHDQQARNGWGNNGRAEGRIASNCINAVELGLGDRQETLDYLGLRLRLAEERRVGRHYTGPIKPLFTSDRGLPWAGWTPWEEAQAAWGWWRLYQVTGEGLALSMAHERATNVAHVLVEEAGHFWIPYRVKDTGNAMPTIEAGDYWGKNIGPNSLFAWASIGLRTLLLTTKELGQPYVEHHRLAARALEWMDATQKPHVADSAMSMRGTHTALIAAVAAAVPA